MTLTVTSKMVDTTVDIARRAGAEIMKIYATDFDVESKDDKSPVTAADRAAETLITDALLSEVTGAYPIVGEEAASAGYIPDVAGTPFWLVDPLDGTKEFIKRNDEFTVNIALIDKGPETRRPILGVVYAPARGLMYWGSSLGAFLQRENENPAPIEVNHRAGPLVVAASRSHRSAQLDQYISQLDVKEEITAGSSLKFCLVAEGRADIYPRLGRTMEWDTAAGHGVVRFAGGHVRKMDGKEMGYGKPGFENPHFVVSGNKI